MEGLKKKDACLLFIKHIWTETHEHTNTLFSCLLSNEARVSIIYPDLKYIAKITAFQQSTFTEPEHPNFLLQTNLIRVKVFRASDGNWI